MADACPPLPADDAPVFADAMWRSGSTYLASCFAQSDRYMLFYEPCHEGVGRPPSAARVRDRGRDRGLRHPQLDGGYFGSYEAYDPLTGMPLNTLYAPEMSLRNVYGAASERSIAYLEALARVARAAGKIPFFGFCRSGTQTALARLRLGARGLHLWRSPREQFASYDWPRNDYFMAGTLLQLALSPSCAPLARTLASHAFGSPLLWLACRLPDRRARDRYRLARPVAATLTPTESYALFYLSWILCFRAGRAQGGPSFSLSELASDDVLRNCVETEFGIKFNSLRATPATVREGFDYDAVEARVAALLHDGSDLPSSAVEYPPLLARSA